MDAQTKNLMDEALEIAQELRFKMNFLNDTESLSIATAIQNNRVLSDINKNCQFIEQSISRLQDE